MKNRLKLLTVLSFILFVALMGLLWLAAGLLVLAGIYVAGSRGRLATWMEKNSFLTSCITFVGIFGLAIAVRVFMLEIYSIPSASMEDTLLPGDKILVSKLNYGPQLPRSPFEIPWVNIFFYITKEAHASPTAPWWSYRRLTGLSDINRSDIVVFETPTEANDAYVKRCVGLPGEWLTIQEGEVLHDEEVYPSPATSKHLYEIKYNHLRPVQHLLDSLQLPNEWHTPVNRRFHPPEIWLTLTTQQRERLRAYAGIDSVLLKVQPPDTVATTFPGDQRFLWTVDNFGPVLIPAEGLTVPLNPANLILYATILEKYERVNIVERDGKYYAGEQEIDQYTFRQNYYFMMGDHRNNSHDSRFWGFVPEENVVGKVVGVLYSAHDGTFKWNRLLTFSL